MLMLTARALAATDAFAIRIVGCDIISQIVINRLQSDWALCGCRTFEVRFNVVVLLDIKRFARHRFHGDVKDLNFNLKAVLCIHLLGEGREGSHWNFTGETFTTSYFDCNKEFQAMITHSERIDRKRHVGLQEKMPSPIACGVIYIIVSGLMLIPAFVPWAAVPRPTSTPTHSPTSSPSAFPTHVPSFVPTVSPTRSPTSSRPSLTPSRSPTSSRPSLSPTTSRPSNAPSTSRPSVNPSRSTTQKPSAVPTTSRPSKSPTLRTASPTTNQPTKQPVTIVGRRQLQDTSSTSSSGDVRLVWLLWLWPCIAHFLMGVSYLKYDPTDVTTHRPFGVVLLGKELDGSMRWYTVLFMVPVLLPLWTFWYFRHSTWLRMERPYDEVVPGIYLGRFPVRTFCSKWTPDQTFPENSSTIVDLVAEMPVPRSVFRKRRYLCIPTLDQCAPNVEALREVGATLAAQDQIGVNNSNSNFRRLNSNEDPDGEGVRVKGSVCVICANGRGRSATFVCVLLVMRGHCDTVEQAVELIRKARPQINPKESQLQAAKEAIDVWRAEEHSRIGSAEKTRNRTASNADAVEMSSPGRELPSPGPQNPLSTESNNVIDLSAVGQSEAKLQTVTSYSRKRGQGEMADESSLFTLIQPVESSADQHCNIAREDLNFIASEAFKHLKRETGGDLFGGFTEEHATVHQVLGPGPNATQQNRAFVQDPDFLRNALTVLSPLGFDRIGQWHSHHEHPYPSEGDKETVFAYLEKTGKRRHILLIVNVTPGKSEAEIAAYYFSVIGSKRKFAMLQVTVVAASSREHDHSKVHQEIELLRTSSAPSNAANEPPLASTESHNVIDLSLQ